MDWNKNTLNNSFTFFDYSGLNENEINHVNTILYHQSLEIEQEFEFLPNEQNKDENLIFDTSKDADSPHSFGFTFVTEDECHSFSHSNQQSVNESPQIDLNPSNVKPTYWSGLFKKSDKTTEKPIDAKPMTLIDSDYPILNSVKTNGISPIQNLKVPNSKMTEKIIPIEKDNLIQSLKAFLSNLPLPLTIAETRYETPRPLVNASNWCYVNSILQCLLSVPPFFTLFYRMGEQIFDPKSVIHNKLMIGDTKVGDDDPDGLHSNTAGTSIPVIKAFSQFVYQNFEAVREKTGETGHSDMNGDNMYKDGGSDLSKKLPKKNNDPSSTNPSFEPRQIYDILPLFQSEFSGRQEDAEEFLSCVLNSLHEEMNRVLTFDGNGKISDALFQPDDAAFSCTASPDSSDWETRIGKRKNKSALIREYKMAPSPIFDIFGGSLCSTLQHSCCKNSNNYQPFFVLPLDIQDSKIKTIQDALHYTFAKEYIPEYHCFKSKKQMDAYKLLQIHECPRDVLIFQFKCFVYEDNASKKLLKNIQFPLTLHLDKDILSAQTHPLTYRLRSIVCHVGTSIAGGHYVTYFRINVPDSPSKYRNSQKPETDHKTRTSSNDANNHSSNKNQKNLFDGSSKGSDKSVPMPNSHTNSTNEREVWWLADDSNLKRCDIESILKRFNSSGGNFYNNKHQQISSNYGNSSTKNGNNEGPCTPYLLLYSKY